MDQCAAQNDLMLLENNFSKKSDEFNQMFSNMNEQVHSRFELQVGHSILIPNSTLPKNGLVLVSVTKRQRKNASKTEDIKNS